MATTKVTSFEETCPHCDHTEEYNSIPVSACKNCGEAVLMCSMCTEAGCGDCSVDNIRFERAPERDPVSPEQWDAKSEGHICFMDGMEYYWSPIKAGTSDVFRSDRFRPIDKVTRRRTTGSYYERGHSFKCLEGVFSDTCDDLSISSEFIRIRDRSGEDCRQSYKYMCKSCYDAIGSEAEKSNRLLELEFGNKIDIEREVVKVIDTLDSDTRLLAYLNLDTRALTLNINGKSLNLDSKQFLADMQDLLSTAMEAMRCSH